MLMVKMAPLEQTRRNQRLASLEFRVKISRPTTMTLAAAGVLALSLLSAAPASADEPVPPHGPIIDVPGTPYQEDPSVESNLAPMPSGEKGGAQTDAGIEISPAGCRGQTDYAHWSQANEASVHGRTKCDVAVSHLGVSTTLQKESWFGFDNMATGSSDYYGGNNSGDATPHWGCYLWGYQTYRGTSYHYSIESSGTYTGNTTGDTSRFTC